MLQTNLHDARMQEKFFRQSISVLSIKTSLK